MSSNQASFSVFSFVNTSPRPEGAGGEDFEMRTQVNRSASKSRKGQGLVEYILIVAAVAMITLVAVSVFGHKMADQYAVAAGMLPGAHSSDNQPIVTGFYAGVDSSGTQTIATGVVSWNAITGFNGGVPGAGGLSNNVVNFGANNGDAFVAD